MLLVRILDTCDRSGIDSFHFRCSSIVLLRFPILLELCYFSSSLKCFLLIFCNVYFFWIYFVYDLNKLSLVNFVKVIMKLRNIFSIHLVYTNSYVFIVIIFSIFILASFFLSVITIFHSPRISWSGGSFFIAWRISWFLVRLFLRMVCLFSSVFFCFYLSFGVALLFVFY